MSPRWGWGGLRFHFADSSTILISSGVRPKHTAEVFQVSPNAAAVRALKLKLLTRDALRRLFPDS